MLWLILVEMQMGLFRSFLFGDRNQVAIPQPSAARARVRRECGEMQEYLMLKALNVTGLTYKLESVAGAILGTVTVPTHWIDLIQKLGGVQLCFSGAVSKYVEHDDDGTVVLRHAALYPSRGNYPDALMLVGASLEEFERIPGCSFTPGAAYLRSVVE
jgi:hypothetical protein